MTRERTSVGAVRRGLPAAVAISMAFLVLLVLTPLLIAAVVTLLAAVTAGAVRTHAVPRPTAHSVVEPSFATTAVVIAPRAAQSEIASTGNAAAAAAAITAA